MVKTPREMIDMTSKKPMTKACSSNSMCNNILLCLHMYIYIIYILDFFFQTLTGNDEWADFGGFEVNLMQRVAFSVMAYYH